MRTLPLLLALACAAPALAQTPAPETITFEGIGTPIAFEPNVEVPSAARIKTIDLAGGGRISFRTRGGAKYAALVTTHYGTTAIVGVTRKGKIEPRRFLDIRIRKNKGARFDSFTPLNVGARIDDKGTTTTQTGQPDHRLDDEVAAYDGPGIAFFRLSDTDRGLHPLSGNVFTVSQEGTTKTPFSLTTTSFDFNRIQIFSQNAADTIEVNDPSGDPHDVPLRVDHMAYDDLVVSYGH